jgi:hypothetical protein
MGAEHPSQLQRQADLVIDYERPDGFRLWVPGGTAPISATDQTLATAMVSATPKRELAVVVIGKAVRHKLSEPQLRAKVDSIEAVVRAHGFTQVIFQFASASGHQPYSR